MSLFSRLLLFDILVLVFCTSLLVRFGQIGFSHPATVYFVFHILGFTWRLFSLNNGAERVFSWPGYLPITDSEYTRAVIVADIGLFVMTVAWLRASTDALKGGGAEETVRKGSLPHMLSPGATWLIAIPTFFIGVIGLLNFSALPGSPETRAMSVDSGGWGRSTWVTGTQMWSGVALLMLIHRYGPRFWLLLPMTVFLIIMGYQGYHRFRLVIPVLLLFQFLLSHRERKWPTLRQAILLIALFLLWLPLKTIGTLARQGVSTDEILNEAAEIVSSSLKGDNELVFLDYLAATMTLCDDHNRFYYFDTYVPMLTLAVPRPLWTDKPRIAFFLDEISTPTRPMAQWGAVVTLYGESYVSFGYFGIFAIPYLVAYIFGRCYFASLTRPYLSVFRLAYLIFWASLLLVYRDGLPSLLVFTVATMMPFFFLFYLSIFRKTDHVHSCESQIKSSAVPAVPAQLGSGKTKRGWW